MVKGILVGIMLFLGILSGLGWVYYSTSNNMNIVFSLLVFIVIMIATLIINIIFVVID